MMRYDLPQNLLHGIPDELAHELIQTLLTTRCFRLERIVSHGHASPDGFWYDQEADEWVLVVSGRAKLQFEGEEPVELSAGSYLSIPARRKHRVVWTDPDQPTIWLAIHYT